MEQLNLFDIHNEERQIEETKNSRATFQLYDQVKIILVDEEIDSELHNFRKYYEPFMIGKVGEIIKVISSKGKFSYEVDVYGEKRIFDECELRWNG